MRIIGVWVVRFRALAQADLQRGGRRGFVPAPDRKAHADTAANPGMASEIATADGYADARAAIAADAAIGRASVDPEPVAVVLERQVGCAKESVIADQRGVRRAARAIGDGEPVRFNLGLGVADAGRR